MYQAFYDVYLHLFTYIETPGIPANFHLKIKKKQEIMVKPEELYMFLRSNYRSFIGN